MAAQNAPNQTQDTDQQSRAARQSQSVSSTNRTDSERQIPTTGEGKRGRTTAGRAMSTRAGTSPALFGMLASPWELVRRMSEDLNQLMQSVEAPQRGISTNRAQQVAPGLGSAGAIGWAPQIEIIDKKDSIAIRADLPGLKPDEVNVQVQDGVLVLSGERQQERQEEEDDGVIRTEVEYGAFYRAIPLPEGAEENRVSAQFKDGVLEVTVPLSNRDRGRRIDVQS